MTIVIFALLGGAIGLALSQGDLSTAFGGAVAGLLVGWINTLGGRVQKLEQQVAALIRDRVAKPAALPARAPAPPPVAAPESAAARADSFGSPSAASAAPATAAAQSPLGDSAANVERAPVPSAAARETAGPAAPRPRRVEYQPSPLEHLFGLVKRWLTTGNVPVKVGVVLSVFGVAFLVKEGIDRRVLVLPLEVRLMLVALFGIALLVLGWRLRDKQRSYALSVQGGGIAVLYLTIYASFALFHLLPAGGAFALLLVVTASAGTLAVLQDARALAVLGIVGGFMAPVLVSSGSGNHVALFSYYAILNVAIVGIAWFKAWRELNVLGFLFTFGIGALWGANAYTPEQFASTEPFLILFTLMYIAIPVLFADRQTPDLRGFVDGTLTFGTPVVAFGLQSYLVADTEYGLAISALALAGLYVGLATWLLKNAAAELRVLVQAQFALGVAFLTVAVPLALDARWTSAAWALQGAAMVWLGFRQTRRLALVAGVALQALSGVEYFDQGRALEADWAVLNGHFLGALLLALAAGFSGRLFDAREEPAAAPGRGGERTLAFPLVAALLLVWASAWWIGAGVVEIGRFVPDRFELAAELVFFAATALLAMLAAARASWPRLNSLGLVLWPAAVLGAALWSFEAAHPAQNLGWVGWLAVLGAMLTFLAAREQRYPTVRPILHASAYWLAGVLIVWETHWQIDRITDGIWPAAAALAVGTACVLATLRLRERVAWPLAAHAATYLKLCCGGAIAALLLATIFGNLVSPGDSSPLPYVPLLNPLEIASVFVGIALLRWLGIVERTVPRSGLEPRHRAAVAGVLGGFLLTMAVARAVHHFANVPFDFDSLARSMVLQTSLSIVWGATALTAMVLGARRKSRVVWITGAALMGIVVVKLFIVELGGSGTLPRIVSFLSVGLLLLVVGYFAPVPPRADLEKRGARAEAG
jgi:uncharacterized membrane protein